jgi:PAT family beta-lactamase induction signal transducer AmpG
MSSLTSAGFTATQYALLSSLYAIPGKIIASQSGRIVESAAGAAEAGGMFAGLKGLFSGLTPESFAGALERSGVSPAALGSGYVVFFGYTALVGIVPLVLGAMLLRRQMTARPGSTTAGS